MGSKFSGIFDKAKSQEAEAPAKVPPRPSPAPAQGHAPKRRGRPAVGKRSDADFVQVTAYIHKDTHTGVKIALLKSSDGKDFSELVESLLGDWLKSRT